MKLKISYFLAIYLISSLTFAQHLSDDLNSEYTQSIQVVNLLANTSLSDPGMTPSPILVKYFNGSLNPCWMATLNYQDDYTIHAGPTQGCRDKVTLVEISPSLVAQKLQVYDSSIRVDIEPQKYVYQINVYQNQPPLFDTRNGLITKPGTIQVKVQTQ